MIRLLVAEDHECTLLGLLDLFSQEPDMEVVATARTGEAALEMSLQLRPDVILMDLRMPGLDGPQATARLIAAWPEARVIAVTSFDLVYDAQRMLAAGARGYLLKDAEPDLLLGVIRGVHSGELSYFAPEVMAKLPALLTSQALQLTARELEVLHLIGEGRNNQEISELLHLQMSTVKAHTSALFRKLAVEDRLGAIRVAIELGLLRIGRGAS